MIINVQIWTDGLVIPLRKHKFVYLRKVFSVDVGTIQNGDHLEMPLHILRNHLMLSN